MSESKCAVFWFLCSIEIQLIFCFRTVPHLLERLNLVAQLASIPMLQLEISSAISAKIRIRLKLIWSIIDKNEDTLVRATATKNFDMLKMNK